MKHHLFIHSYCSLAGPGGSLIFGCMLTIHLNSSMRISTKNKNTKYVSFNADDLCRNSIQLFLLLLNDESWSAKMNFINLLSIFLNTIWESCANYCGCFLFISSSDIYFWAKLLNLSDKKWLFLGKNYPKETKYK